MNKFLITIFALTALFVGHAEAATCTAPSRTNVSANSVLTSTEYNTSLNNLYSALASGSLDLGCAAASSLDDTATLDSTEFNALLNGVKEGCVITNTDTNTISVERCMMAVNGNFVKTTSATTVTWGCSGCQSESADQLSYVYAATGSEGSTLTLKILAGAPNADGYDASGNRVIGKFYNNASSNIVAVQPVAWGSSYDKYTTNTTNQRIESARLLCNASSSIGSQSGTWVSTIGNRSSDTCAVTLLAGLFSATPRCVVADNSTAPEAVSVNITSATAIDIYNASAADFVVQIICTGTTN